MGTKIKGIYKGFKYISQIFVVKDREMEIGYPTDVKHVSHIGWDGPSGSAPSWMDGFKTGPDFAATSIRNSGSAFSPWSSKGITIRMSPEFLGMRSEPLEMGSGHLRTYSMETHRNMLRTLTDMFGTVGDVPNTLRNVFGTLVPNTFMSRITIV